MNFQQIVLAAKHVQLLLKWCFSLQGKPFPWDENPSVNCIYLVMRCICKENPPNIFHDWFSMLVNYISRKISTNIVIKWPKTLLATYGHEASGHLSCLSACFYRLRNRGDNMFGSIRLSVWACGTYSPWSLSVSVIRYSFHMSRISGPSFFSPWLFPPWPEWNPEIHSFPKNSLPYWVIWTVFD